MTTATQACTYVCPSTLAGSPPGLSASGGRALPLSHALPRLFDGPATAVAARIAARAAAEVAA
ncbi:hypothetical protein IMZ11_08110 [Microtetraspora sp. AC03309]|uniref:hypothetical protein n=1 Tax=Microtetraspora sp. AC03309 TaxID=2779376 RepID=UPI001E622B10|nr:hypothetical protein [Microtetraspora sp. AC03309]MCC5575604.1 hypothetical protein [Microtetraspora sp. AC03309]